MIRWDYQVVKIPAEGFWLGGVANVEKIEKELNARGVDGWELVSSFDTTMGQGTTREIVFVLKKPY